MGGRAGIISDCNDKIRRIYIEIGDGGNNDYDPDDPEDKYNKRIAIYKKQKDDIEKYSNII